MAETKQRISVLLDLDDFQCFENYCISRGFKKSTLIARLIRDHLETEGFSFQRELPVSFSSEKIERDRRK